MRIIYDNIIDALSSSSVVTSSDFDGYSFQNLQDQRLARRWVSDSGATAQTATFTLDTFPAYPDSATGTTYIQDAWASVDSFSQIGSGSVLATAGTLIETSGGGATDRAQRALAIPTGSTIIARVKRSGGTAGFLQITTDVAVIYSEAVNLQYDWKIVQGYVATAATALRIYPNSGGADVGVVTVDWIYVGTGAYTTTLPDLSGNGNNASVFGAIKASATAGSVLYFDGVNDYVDVPIMSNNGIFTLAGWVKTSDKTDSNGIVANSRAATNNLFSIYIAITTGYATAIWRDGSVANVTLAGNVDLADGQYHHIAATTTGAVVKLYVDGVLVNTNAATTLATDAITATYIGRLGGVYASGYIDDARIYYRALSASEVAKLYAGTPFVGEMSSLAGWWKPDHGLEVNTAAVLGHNLKSGTIAKVQATNNSADWTTPELNTTLTVNDGAILNFATTSSVYKYWRFYFYGQGSIEVGRMWLGQYMTIDPSSTLDMKVTRQTSDIVSHSRSRQKFATPGVVWRRFDLSFPKTDEDMLYSLTVLQDAVGQHSSFIFCNFDDIRDYVLVEPCYVSLAEDITFSHADRMGFTYSLVMEEEL